MGRPLKVFDPATFLRDLDEGKFDGRIREELDRLTDGQLREVSRLLTKRFEKTQTDTEE